MSQDIAKYIKVVGKDNLKKYLKENLKIELHGAIANENWKLVKEVTELLEIIFNQNNFENEQVLIRSTEIVGISKLNLQLKTFLNTSIEGEQWSSAQEIAKILDDYLPFDNTSNIDHIKIHLKNILYESIKEEDWYLTEYIIELIKNNFSCLDKYIYIVDKQNVKSQFKKILYKLTETNHYSLVVKIITTIQEDLIRYTKQVKEVNKKSEKLQKEYQIHSTEVYEKLEAILVEQLEIEEERIEPNSIIYKTQFVFWCSSEKSQSYDSDLGCDDLNFIELLMAVEEEFDMEINNKQEAEIVTVKDLYDVVVCNLAE